MNGHGSNLSSPKGQSPESSRSVLPSTDCSAPEAQGDSPPPNSSTVDGTTPAGPSGERFHSGTYAHQDSQLCDFPGCEIIAESSQMSQDGRIDRVCAEHKKPAVIAAAITRAAHCEHAGCSKTPRYGPQDGPLSFCQAHKRAGQYTVRDGQLFVATRDGRAFRGNPGTAASQATASTATVAPPQDTKTLLSVPGSGNPRLSSSDKETIREKGRPCLVPGGRGKSGFNATEGKAGPGSKENAGKAADEGEDKAAEEATKSKERKINGGTSTSLSPPSTSSTPSSSPRPALAQEKRRATAPGLPPSGLTPSDEIRLLQEARESARVAAEASGSGRRPRVPSRKLLEASGKMTGDSIQWMTKEKREEEARLKLEMKEHRKAAAAAGLKFGHFIEALTLSTPVDARAETGHGEVGSAGAWSGIKDAVSKVFWRKLTPGETVQAAGKHPTRKGARVNLHGSKATMADAADGVTLGEQDNGVPVAPADAAAARKRKGVASAPIVEVGSMKKTKRSRPTRGKA